MKCIANQFVNFPFSDQLPGPSLKTNTVYAPLLAKISKPYTVMLPPLRPRETLPEMRIFVGGGGDPACKQPLSCRLPATEALLGRPSCEPAAFKKPHYAAGLSGAERAGVFFGSHVGTRALYTLQWHCGYFVFFVVVVSLGKRREARKEKGCEKTF